MKLSFDYSEFFQRNEKIMTNSEIEPFPSYSLPSELIFIILSSLTIAGTGLG